MATLSAALVQGLDSLVPRSKRKLQKHLRSAGLAYISRTGKIIPAKEVAGELCQCPQKCDDRVPLDVRERLFQHFYGLGDADKQNEFLRRHMDVRARANIPETTISGRAPRRITCKYLVPLLPKKETADVCQKAFVSAFVITTKRVRLQREKLIASMGLNSYSSHSRSKSTPNNPLDSYLKSMAAAKLSNSLDEESMESNEEEDSPEVPEKKKKKNPDDPLIPLGLIVPEGVTIAPVTATPDHDRDIAIVNNFFSNQLWKPEYLCTYS